MQEIVCRTHEAGLRKKWLTDFALGLNTRSEYLVKKYMRAPLTLLEMVPAFYILIVGWSLASVVFVMELIVYKCWRRRNARLQQRHRM